MNKQEILSYVAKKFQKKEAANFRVGDTVRVHVRIKEGSTSRVQVFEGIVISFKGHGDDQTFTARKISFGVGVERIFPFNSPTIEKIQVVRSGHARRAKLYYLRSRVGKAAKLDEVERSDNPSKKSKGASNSSHSAENLKQELVGTEPK